MGKVHETSLGQVKHGIIPETLRCSSDGKRVSYVIQAGASSYVARNFAGMKYFVVIDGNLHMKEVDGIQPESLKFSPDSLRVGYTAKIDKLFHVVIDNDVTEGYAAVGKDSPIFSPNSQRVAYAVAIEKSRTFYVIDGIPDRQFVSVSNLTFSADSQRIGYIAQLAHDQFITVIDAVPGQPYQGMQHPGLIFSPDSQRVAYAALKGSYHAAVIDGKEDAEFDRISIPIFSPDSRHVAYTAKKGNKWYICLDGNIGGEGYEAIGSSDVIFRQDSTPAYIVWKKSGLLGPKKWFVVAGGKTSPVGYDGIGVGSPVFSPDSMRTAYAAQRGDKWFVVVDAQSGPESSGVSDPIFSPDSRHYAYHITTSTGQMCLISDGKQEMLYDGVGGTGLLFSPDSQHFAYSAKKKDADFVVIDGEEIGPYDGFVNTSHFVFDGNRLRALALKGYEIIKVEIEL